MARMNGDGHVHTLARERTSIADGWHQCRNRHIDGDDDFSPSNTGLIYSMDAHGNARGGSALLRHLEDVLLMIFSIDTAEGKRKMITKNPSLRLAACISSISNERALFEVRLIKHDCPFRLTTIFICADRTQKSRHSFFCRTRISSF